VSRTAIRISPGRFMRRRTLRSGFCRAAKRFYEKKAAQRNPILAMKALSHGTWGAAGVHTPAEAMSAITPTSLLQIFSSPGARSPCQTEPDPRWREEYVTRSAQSKGSMLSRSSGGTTHSEPKVSRFG